MDLITPNPGLMLWTLIIVGILAIILAKFAWKPILEAIDAREKSIGDALKQAEDARNEAKLFQEEHEKKVKKAQDEISELLKKGREDAELLKEKIIFEAKQEAESLKTKANEHITNEIKTAVTSLQKEMGGIALDIASKILDKELDSSEHERLISGALDELDEDDILKKMNLH